MKARRRDREVEPGRRGRDAHGHHARRRLAVGLLLEPTLLLEPGLLEARRRRRRRLAVRLLLLLVLLVRVEACGRRGDEARRRATHAGHLEAWGRNRRRKATSATVAALRVSEKEEVESRLVSDNALWRERSRPLARALHDGPTSEGGTHPRGTALPPMPIPGGPIGLPGPPVGSTLFLRACWASMRSASVPCRSPFPSFLNAYWTVTALFIRYWPFIDSIAASADSKSLYETKP